MQVTNEELRALKPLVVAVVGPTNEGKTSILRTLTSDPNFGLVNAYNGTTVRAEIQKIFYKGVVEILQLVDTPGFQTSGEIYELLMEDEAVQERLGAFDLDDLFRVVPQQDDDFRHDLRAWREVARCDAVIFVVNVVENPKQSLLKYTLALLKNIGKPVVVAYNNTHVESATSVDATGAGVTDYRAEWDETLRKNSFFLVQEYDAHIRSFNDELELFEKLAALARDPLTQRVLRLEIRERRARELRRLQTSRHVVAELLLDVAAYREIKTDVGQNEWQLELERLEEVLKQTVITREHEAQVALLEAWGFHVGVLDREMLSVEDDANQRNQLFGAEAKRHVSVGGGVGVTVGAILGGAIDACVGGLSFGTGAMLGGFLGGLAGGGGALAYNSKYDSKGKTLTVRVQQNVVDALLARGVDLAKKLQSRGKALEDSAQSQIGADAPKIAIPGLAGLLAEYAAFSEYSKMNKGADPGFTARDWRKLPGVSKLAKEKKTREEVVQTIADMLRQAIPDLD
ncbi:MAG: DUF3482 domain-containing protein [Thermoguttaceae bacterium]|nr:DUF3482 domain-containing protein [Thermoguttaceae bacterium]